MRDEVVIAVASYPDADAARGRIAREQIAVLVPISDPDHTRYPPAFVERQSQDRKVSAQHAVIELVSLGFETLFRQSYDRYRRGEISFGRLAQEMGVTTWELSHLLEERDWPGYNLPSGA